MDLQALINAQPPSGKLESPPGEFFGQVTIDRPLTILGHGKATWIGSRIDPTIRITSPGVKLQNLIVENTTGHTGIAIEAEPGTEPILENVVVSGLLVGIPFGNIRDYVQADDTAPIEISFLPPPPISPSDSSEATSSSCPATPVSEPTQASLARMTSSSPSPEGSPTPATTPPLRAKGSMTAIFRDPMKAFLIGMCVVMGIVLALHYMDARRSGIRQIDEVKQLLNQADADKSQLLLEIGRLKALIAQKEKDIATLRAVNVEGRQEIESLKKEKQRLEQEVAKVTATLAQKSRPQVLPVKGKLGAELITAATQGDVNLVKSLLDDGADFNYRDGTGWTPLMHAITFARIDLVSLLVQRGAEVNAKDNDGWTPLMLACARTNMEMVKLLLDRGADVNARQSRGWTALKSASGHKAREIEHLLRSHGARE